MAKKIFVSAGEPSGDLHASRLVKEIKILDPSVIFMGMGGANMESEGVRLFIRTDELAIVGFDILRHLKKIKEMFDAFLANAEKEKPDLVILLDYPGFNLRLARALKKRGIKVVYYISPQLWAWGKNRIYTVKKYVDKMLVFFPFEGELYKKYGIPVEVVGHPLLDIAKPAVDQKAMRERLRFDSGGKKTIILLPGSREREVISLMPVMAAAILELYKKHKNIQIIIVRASNLPQELFDQYLKTVDIPYRVVENKGSEIYDYLSVSDLAIVASGTATLECGIMNVPMIITYKVSMFNAAIFRLFINVPYVGLVNILAGKEIVPELLQFDATPYKIYEEAEKILFDGKKAEEMKKELLKVRESLGKEGASRRAAEAVVRLLLNRDYSDA